MDKSLEHIVRVYPAYDRRAEGYGCGNANIFFTLKGPKGAISLSVDSGWALDGVPPYKAIGRAVCEHRLTKVYDEEMPHEDCEWLDGQTCYGGCSYVTSDEFFEVLVRDGEDAMWEKLEEWYERLPEVEANG